VYRFGGGKPNPYPLGCTHCGENGHSKSHYTSTLVPSGTLSTSFYERVLTNTLPFFSPILAYNMRPAVNKAQTAALEWTLPDVLPGICRLFLRVPMVLPTHTLPQPTTHWCTIALPETDLCLYRVRIALRTLNGINTQLQAVFLEEPRLDQMKALDAYAAGLAKHGLPALVAGQF
jgi:hypothetical protein